MVGSSLVSAEKVADHTLISTHFTNDCTQNLVTIPIDVASGIQCGWFKTIVLNMLARKMCINSLIPISISDYLCTLSLVHTDTHNMYNICFAVGLRFI